MDLGMINYLDISALLEAEREGRLIEELESQRSSTGASGLSTESYCVELLKMKKSAQVTGLSVNDVKRKEFHTNY